MTIESLLREQLEERLDLGMRVAALLGEGVRSDSQIAEVLGVTADQVRESKRDLETVAARLRTLDQR